MVQGRGRATAGSTATRWRVEHLARDQAGRRRLRAHLFRPRGRRVAIGVSDDSLFGAPGARSSPAASNSPVRAFSRGGRRAVLRGAAPDGADLVDTEGRRYIDYVQSWGASILGHAHPAHGGGGPACGDRGGTSYGAPTDARGRAGRGDRAHGCPRSTRSGSCRSGTEAAMTAVRLARGATGRDQDPEVRRLLPRAPRRAARRRREAASPRSACRARPASPRAPSPTPSSCPTTTSRRSTPRSTARHELAAVARRAGRRQHGPRPARRGFLEDLRRRCTADAGALLVFDEVITGFRVGAGGAQGAVTASRPTCRCSARSWVGACRSPPSAAGPTIMDHLAPLGPVYQAGTLSGNPLATAAGLAVLGAARTTAAYADLEPTGRPRFADGLARRVRRRRVPPPR